MSKIVSHHIKSCIIPTLRDYIRLYLLDKAIRCIVFKYDYLVHTAQRLQHALAVGLTVDRAAQTLEAAHQIIGVKADNQLVAQRAGLFEVLDMADVEDVKAAVGKDCLPELF